VSGLAQGDWPDGANRSRKLTALAAGFATRTIEGAVDVVIRQVAGVVHSADGWLAAERGVAAVVVIGV
jgi:hypothetical protein